MRLVEKEGCGRNGDYGERGPILHRIQPVCPIPNTNQNPVPGALPGRLAGRHRIIPDSKGERLVEPPVFRQTAPPPFMRQKILSLSACLAAACSASARDSAVIINEVQYHPATEPAQSEWLELRCLHGVDVDISDWRLEGGIDFRFPAGTIINGRGFIVVAQNPGALSAVTALGPWTGKLDNGGEEIRLVNNNDRVMDRLNYGDGGDWPVGADGSGATLARRLQNEAHDGPAGWAASNELGGTPGGSNFSGADAVAINSTPVRIDSAAWKYEDSDTVPPANWKTPAFADAGWSTGRALFFNGTAKPGEPALPATVLSGAGEGLYSYWTMDDAAGSPTAANSVAGRIAGTLNGAPGTAVDFTTDAAPRLKVLRVNLDAASVNTTGSWVDAGLLPAMTTATNFTWAFWAKSTDGATSDVLLGNRYNGPGATDFTPREFIKFTTSSFEWHRNGTAEDLNYTDIPNSSWIHHAMVKAGPLLTYYRNGAATGTLTISEAPVNPQPFFMGGNGAAESWSGWIDDVALWERALPASAITALAANTQSPLTVHTVSSFVDNGPFPVPAAVQFPTALTTPVADDFAAPAVDVLKWEEIDQGLENTAVSGLTATQSGGQLTMGGTSTVTAWAGKSLRNTASFSTRSRVTAEVDRVSLTGVGGARRSSLWLWADASHYLHFSQNIGQSGWTWNASDTGGTGTLNAIGTGNNLTALDSFDANTGPAHLKLVWVPGTYQGRGTIEIWRDTVLAASHNVTNWPAACRMILTGQARNAGESVSAVFDNAVVTVVAPAPLQTMVRAATTHYFRNPFTYHGDPARTTLALWPIHDDAAVYYLNGTEIHRDNIGPAPSHSTPANTTVGDASFPRTVISVPAGALVSGANVLAVEVHQDSAASADLLFGAQLMASEVPVPVRDHPALRLSEISGATDPVFRLELVNPTADPLDLSEFRLTDSSGHSIPLSGTLAAGDFLVLDETALGFRPVDGARIFVLKGGQFYDARTVTGRLRGLNAEGLWAYPAAPGFGTANTFVVNDGIVINELMAKAPSPSPEQWVELYNRSTAPVDLSGWTFNEGISYQFPAGTPPVPPGAYALVVWDVAAFEVLHPGLPRVFGPFTGSLSGKGEALQLRDAAGNPADELSYADHGPWPGFATGTASSLELRHPAADNARGAAWAASNETARGTWQNIDHTFTGVIATSHPNYYSELILGMINDGEVLVDDLSVRLNPATTNVELVQNGTFSDGTTAKWRFPGNHRRSVVMDDPDSPGNKVLKLVSGGSLDHMSNHAESTLKNGATLMGAGALSPTASYRISFRARWWKGHNALNSHLYFSRGPQTTVLNRPLTGGTPGAVNSAYSAVSTITMGDVTHSPAVPPALQPVTVSALAHDPLNTAALTLIYSVNAGVEQTVPMTLADGRWTATIPGQAASAKAIFRIEAINSLAHTAVWPANGMAGRAMIPWNDNQAQLVRPNGARPHNVRIVLPAADITLLHLASNVMSNDWMPCTVIYDEREVYYGTSVHLKGSEHGRAKDVRVGFLLRFPADHLFLGLHDEVGIDRSGAGDEFSQKEILVKRSMNRAGGIPCTEDDLIRVIAPRPTHTGPAIFIHNKIDSDNFLDGQFANGSSGTMYEYELLYPVSSTDTGGLEGNKVTQDGPGPTGIGVGAIKVPGTATDSLNKEDYRWFWLIKNNRTRDDYTGLITGLTALGKTGAAFHTATAPVIDTDGWLRSFTGPVAWAAADNYAYDSQHNCLYFVKPDGKVLYIPWDMDFTASAGSTASLNPNTQLGKMINAATGTTADEANKRAYYGYLLHMVNTGFNGAYLGRWMDHYSTFVNENFRTNFMAPFVTPRETFIRNGINSAVPNVPFRITSNAGGDYTEPLSSTTVSGDGWVNVATISLAGGQPLAVTWTDANSWRLVLPVLNGPNLFTFEARDLQGNLVGTKTITVTGSGGLVPAAASNIALTELNYNPPVPGEEFLELLNVSSLTVELSGCTFTAGLTYTFPAGTQLAPGTRMVLAENRVLFQARYPSVTALAPGEYTPSNLSNGGETVTLQAANGLSNVFSVAYSDTLGSTDGGGSTLIRSLASAAPDLTQYVWRRSTEAGGNPGTSDAIAFSGSPTADADGDGFIALMEYAFGTSDTDASSFPPPLAILQDPGTGLWQAAFSTVAGADDVEITPEASINLSTWTAPEISTPPLPPFLPGDVPGTRTTWTSGPATLAPGAQQFIRLRVTLR